MLGKQEAERLSHAGKTGSRANKTCWENMQRSNSVKPGKLASEQLSHAGKLASEQLSHAGKLAADHLGHVGKTDSGAIGHAGKTVCLSINIH